MKRYYIEVNGNNILSITKVEGKDIDDIEIADPFVEVSEDFYNKYKDKIPATFELDKDGNMVNIIPLPKPEPELPELSLEEQINLQIAQHTAETIELIASLNEMQKIEQAQANTELIELTLLLTGGVE